MDSVGSTLRSFPPYRPPTRWYPLVLLSTGGLSGHRLGEASRGLARPGGEWAYLQAKVDNAPSVTHLTLVRQSDRAALSV